MTREKRRRRAKNALAVVAAAAATAANKQDIALAATAIHMASPTTSLRMELFSEAKAHWAAQHRQVFCQVRVIEWYNVVEDTAGDCALLCRRAA